LPIGACPAGRPGKGNFKGENYLAHHCMAHSPQIPKEKWRYRHDYLRRGEVDGGRINPYLITTWGFP
jgi:hypothetical protein